MTAPISIPTTTTTPAKTDHSTQLMEPLLTKVWTMARKTASVLAELSRSPRNTYGFGDEIVSSWRRLRLAGENYDRRESRERLVGSVAHNDRAARDSQIVGRASNR